MAKCTKCNKLVSKKSPGIQCNKCNKWLHATCASLTNEQLSTLYATEAADWKCRVCTSHSKHKRISVILPEPEEDEATDTELTPQPNMADSKTITDVYRQLTDIRRQIREDIQDEIKRSLQFYSDKIDDFQQQINKYEEQVRTTENKYKDLNNKYTNLKLKYNLIEQKTNAMEQMQHSTKLEICGIAKQNNENLLEITQKICKKLQHDESDIIRVHRKESTAPAAKKRNHSVVVVTLREGDKRDEWLQAAKSTTITAADLGREGGDKIFLRESLTPAMASLLWKAKADLKTTNLYKFVWCKRGTILARKGESEKIKVIRCEEDIERLSECKG